MTTQSLEKAFAEAAKLPACEQDALAAVLMDEIAAEKQWDEAFANSQDVLATLADEALAEHKKRQTRPLASDYGSSCRSYKMALQVLAGCA